ncbi:MAG: hypothetical protein KF914_10950 [Rhizobiaceae bacterium]|nr:hypothetical protein [Rhizobiaceae bacterium]
MRSLKDAADCELLRHAASSKSLLWAVDIDGTPVIAVEELAPIAAIAHRRGLPRRRNLVHPVEERKLGHPCLVAGGAARIAGELFLQHRNGAMVWFMNVNSGRYCYDNPPSDVQIRNAAAMFLQRGLPVEVDSDF